MRRKTAEALTHLPDTKRVQAFCARKGITRIALGKSGRFTLIDAADLPLISQRKWYPKAFRGTIYAGSPCVIRKNWSLESVALHRLILGLERGNPVLAEHRNGVPLDNRRDNLRRATRSQNSANRKQQSTSRQPYKGVGRDKDSPHRPWYACVKINNRNCYLGFFASPIEAAKAYDAKAREVWGEFAHLNFPETI